MIHSHCYIESAPFTEYSIPCGAIEEADEVIKGLIKNYGSLELEKYVINLLGHGSICMGKTIENITGLTYTGRKLPEKMFK